MDKERDFVKAGCAETHSGGATTRIVAQAQKDIIETRVKNLMEDKKVFLDPTMSLQKFSALTNTNTTYLSNTVNDCFGCSFRTLLNKYRIKESIRLMKVEGGFVDNLYQRCGFRSRSAFYASFKAVTNKTPLRFIKAKLYR